ncbi:hypothetical protein [Arthrobacter sp. HLT1-21]
MSAYRTRKDAHVVVRNGKPTELFNRPAHLDYRNKSELCSQLTQFVRGVWTTAKRIDIDSSAGQIMVDGELVASYYLSDPKQNTGSLEALL